MFLSFNRKFEELGIFHHGHERRESTDQEPVEVAPEPASDSPEVVETYPEEGHHGEEEGPLDPEEELMLSMRRNYRNSVVSTLSFEIENFDFRLDENRSTIIKTEASLEFLDDALDQKLEHLTEIGDGLEAGVPGDRGTIIAEESDHDNLENDESEENEDGRATPTQTQRVTPLTEKPPGLPSDLPTVQSLQERIAEMEVTMRRQQESLIELFTEEQKKSKQLEETIVQVRLFFSSLLFVFLTYFI